MKQVKVKQNKTKQDGYVQLQMTWQLKEVNGETKTLFNKWCQNNCVCIYFLKET